MTRPRWSILVLGIALLAAATDEAAARSPAADAARARKRCERAIEREGHRFADLYSAQLTFCLRALGECGTADGSPGLPCSAAGRMCEALAASDGGEERLQARLLEACGDVPFDHVMHGMGFATQMVDCAPTTLRTFTDCLGAKIMATQGELAGQLRPTACALLEGAGLADDFADVRCTPGEGCEPCEPGDPQGPAACGGPTALTCATGLACDRRDALCSNADVSGTCVAMPETCTDEGQPVCGCDGQTYASDCARLQAGVTLAREGACDPPPTSCSSSNNCPPGFFCEYVFADCGEGQPGTCQPMRSEPCNLCSAWVDGPVCGCDGQTYASECDRQAAGVSKFWFGPCF